MILIKKKFFYIKVPGMAWDRTRHVCAAFSSTCVSGCSSFPISMVFSNSNGPAKNMRSTVLQTSAMRRANNALFEALQLGLVTCSLARIAWVYQTPSVTGSFRAMPSTCKRMPNQRAKSNTFCAIKANNQQRDQVKQRKFGCTTAQNIRSYSTRSYRACFTKSSNELIGMLSRESDQSKYLGKFFNQCFDKGRLKNFVLWFLLNYGEYRTVRLVEQLKNIGFYYASKAGISLGIDDLKIPPKKAILMYEAENQTTQTIQQYNRGEITGVERFQRLIDTWHRTSEILKQEVIDYFEATDILNPVYMMAFSGARGNISQVRQLVGMRGLMADPQGQIIDFPIRSNFREGLTVTEYIISSYGARKGIVDTALRTANAGYLTRRLVDVAQHVIISNFDCNTTRGIFLINMKEGNKTIHSLNQRLVGRILARDIIKPTNVTEQSQSESFQKIASRNEEITLDLAFEIAKHFNKVFVRSPLTCQKPICQLCYGWSLAQGRMVSIGEAVGIVAAQSIGEPGTQLTMRTFHTGGVFSGDISDQIKAPFNGIIEYISPIPGTLIRTPEGKIAFLTKSEGSFLVKKVVNNENNLNKEIETKKFTVPHHTLLYIRNSQNVYKKEVIAQISSISQKTNATDEAELTIKSDIEGQFYSKFVTFREKLIGQSLSSGHQLLASSGYQSQSQRLHVRAQGNEEKIYEAWTWAYAWVLSGKIYDFKNTLPDCTQTEISINSQIMTNKLNTTFLPITGDLLTTKSYMAQTRWGLGNKNNLDFYYIKRTPSTCSLQNFSLSTQSNISNQFKNNNIKAAPIENKPVLAINLNSINFKNYAYIFEVSQQVQFLTSASSQFSASSLMKISNNNLYSCLNDFLFFAEIPFYKNKTAFANSLTSQTLTEPKQNGKIKNKKKFLSNIANSKTYQSIKKVLNSKQFSYIIQWFPNKYKTGCGGVVFLNRTKFVKTFLTNNAVLFNSAFSNCSSLVLSETNTFEKQVSSLKTGGSHQNGLLGNWLRQTEGVWFAPLARTCSAAKPKGVRAANPTTLALPSLLGVTKENANKRIWFCQSQNTRVLEKDKTTSFQKQFLINRHLFLKTRSIQNLKMFLISYNVFKLPIDVNITKQEISFNKSTSSISTFTEEKIPSFISVYLNTKTYLFQKNRQGAISYFKFTPLKSNPISKVRPSMLTPLFLLKSGSAGIPLQGLSVSDGINSISNNFNLVKIKTFLNKAQVNSTTSKDPFVSSLNKINFAKKEGKERKSNQRVFINSANKSVQELRLLSKAGQTKGKFLDKLEQEFTNKTISFLKIVQIVKLLVFENTQCGNLLLFCKKLDYLKTQNNLNVFQVYAKTHRAMLFFNLIYSINLLCFENSTLLLNKFFKVLSGLNNNNMKIVKLIQQNLVTISFTKFIKEKVLTVNYLNQFYKKIKTINNKSNFYVFANIQPCLYFTQAGIFSPSLHLSFRQASGQMLGVGSLLRLQLRACCSQIEASEVGCLFSSCTTPFIFNYFSCSLPLEELFTSSRFTLFSHPFTYWLSPSSPTPADSLHQRASEKMLTKKPRPNSLLDEIELEKSKSFVYNKVASNPGLLKLNQLKQNMLVKNKQITKKAVFYGTSKNGWVVVIPNKALFTNEKWLNNYHKKIIYTGKPLFNNIVFNQLIFVESFVINNAFNIKNVSSFYKNLFFKQTFKNFTPPVEVDSQVLPARTYVAPNTSIEFTEIKDPGGLGFQSAVKPVVTGTTNLTKNLVWVNNKKCRFLLPYTQTNTKVAYLLQPVKEFDEMTDFSLKKYAINFVGPSITGKTVQCSTVFSNSLRPDPRTSPSEKGKGNTLPSRGNLNQLYPVPGPGSAVNVRGVTRGENIAKYKAQVNSNLRWEGLKKLNTKGAAFSGFRQFKYLLSNKFTTFEAWNRDKFVRAIFDHITTNTNNNINNTNNTNNTNNSQKSFVALPNLEKYQKYSQTNSNGHYISNFTFQDGVYIIKPILKKKKIQIKFAMQIIEKLNMQNLGLRDNSMLDLLLGNKRKSSLYITQRFNKNIGSFVQRKNKFISSAKVKKIKYSQIFINKSFDSLLTIQQFKNKNAFLVANTNKMHEKLNGQNFSSSMSRLSSQNQESCAYVRRFVSKNFCFLYLQSSDFRTLLHLHSTLYFITFDLKNNFSNNNFNFNNNFDFLNLLLVFILYSIYIPSLKPVFFGNQNSQQIFVFSPNRQRFNSGKPKNLKGIAKQPFQNSSKLQNLHLENFIEAIKQFNFILKPSINNLNISIQFVDKLELLKKASQMRFIDFINSVRNQNTLNSFLQLVLNNTELTQTQKYLNSSYFSNSKGQRVGQSSFISFVSRKQFNLSPFLLRYNNLNNLTNNNFQNLTNETNQITNNFSKNKLKFNFNFAYSPMSNFDNILYFQQPRFTQPAHWFGSAAHAQVINRLPGRSVLPIQRLHVRAKGTSDIIQSKSTLRNTNNVVPILDFYINYLNNKKYNFSYLQKNILLNFSNNNYKGFSQNTAPVVLTTKFLPDTDLAKPSQIKKLAKQSSRLSQQFYQTNKEKYGSIINSKNVLNYSLLFDHLFESPCFSFNIINLLEVDLYKPTKTKKTRFLYAPFKNQQNINKLASAFFTKSQQGFINYEFMKGKTNHYSPFRGEIVYDSYYDNNSKFISKIDAINHSCMFITNQDLISYYLPTQYNSYTSNLKGKALNTDIKVNETQNTQYKNYYQINNTLIKISLSTMKQEINSNQVFFPLVLTGKDYDPSNDNKQSRALNQDFIQISKIAAGKPFVTGSPFRMNRVISIVEKFSNKPHNFNNINSEKNQPSSSLGLRIRAKNKQEQNLSHLISKTAPLLGDFYAPGDPVMAVYNGLFRTNLIISENDKKEVSFLEKTAPSGNSVVQKSGQIIHYNNSKITIRRAQPVFISPKGVLHKFDGDFIDPKTPIITLSYQQLKTGDIIQGIPKVEQFFEARTTKRGRLFRDSLPSLLKALFKRYQNKLPLESAVRQSFYKIQQIIVDGVQRVYKSQGVTISDKHLEVIVKQMTSKVRIIDGAQTGFFPGEIVDLTFIEKVNQFLINKVLYEPLVLGITKASLEVDSFLSASSFQQTTRVLSQAAIYRKKDFLKGLKENVILGNLIPAGTGYLVQIDDL